MQKTGQDSSTKCKYRYFLLRSTSLASRAVHQLPCLPYVYPISPHFMPFLALITSPAVTSFIPGESQPAFKRTRNWGVKPVRLVFSCSLLSALA